MGLDEIRKEIGKVDTEILRLSKRRLELAEEVGRIKAAANIPVRDAGSERSVIDRYRRFASDNGMDPDNAEELSRILMKESVEVQAAMPRGGPAGRRIAVVGGNGRMGRWFADMLGRSGNTVDIIDPSADNGLTLEDSGTSDVVIVSVPISRTGSVLERLDGICGDHTLIFDIASLKSPFIDILKDMGGRRKVCSVHPMFGPSADSMFDRNLIICGCGSEEAVSEAALLLGNNGPNIRVMGVDEHDRYMSYVLGLSHAVNIAFFTALERSGIPYRDMRSAASTTFLKLMDTNESVALEDPYLYYEIQHMNASKGSMLKEFNDSVNDVVDAALDDDPGKFRELMDRGRRYFL